MYMYSTFRCSLVIHANILKYLMIRQNDLVITIISFSDIILFGGGDWGEGD